MLLVMLDRWLLWECCFELVNTSVHDLVTEDGGGGGRGGEGEGLQTLYRL
jgi:hypothetical protein